MILNFKLDDKKIRKTINLKSHWDSPLFLQRRKGDPGVLSDWRLFVGRPPSLRRPLSRSEGSNNPTPPGGTHPAADHRSDLATPLDEKKRQKIYQNQD